MTFRSREKHSGCSFSAKRKLWFPINPRSSWRIPSSGSVSPSDSTYMWGLRWNPTIAMLEAKTQEEVRPLLLDPWLLFSEKQPLLFTSPHEDSPRFYYLHLFVRHSPHLWPHFAPAVRDAALSFCWKSLTLKLNSPTIYPELTSFLGMPKWKKNSKSFNCWSKELDSNQFWTGEKQRKSSAL